ncbi:MAG: hypothetical protein JWP47_440 [Polaromonas sp.]|jgi:DNA ligase-associated metallophosphoesterase|nr:hypothetical protein [Polaromonas sp.]
MLDITLSGLAQPLQLLPGGAVWLPQLRTLLIADAHFGKAVTFRRLGVPVPEGTTGGTLERLDALVAQTGARQVVFLGDFLHSAWAHAPSTQNLLARWRAAHPALRLTLVRGNHDDRAGDPPTALGMAVVDEPLIVGEGAGQLALCHHPQRVPGSYVLAGHWHPCVSLSGTGRDRLRLPCFWFGDPGERAVGVLPAFGSFTGMHPISRMAGDRVFAVAGQAVREVPA